VKKKDLSPAALAVIDKLGAEEVTIIFNCGDKDCPSGQRHPVTTTINQIITRICMMKDQMGIQSQIEETMTGGKITYEQALVENFIAAAFITIDKTPKYLDVDMGKLLDRVSEVWIQQDEIADLDQKVVAQA
jgi:hypothetical protein